MDIVWIGERWGQRDEPVSYSPFDAVGILRDRWRRDLEARGEAYEGLYACFDPEIESGHEVLEPPSKRPRLSDQTISKLTQFEHLSIALKKKIIRSAIDIWLRRDAQSILNRLRSEEEVIQMIEVCSTGKSIGQSLDALNAKKIHLNSYVLCNLKKVLALPNKTRPLEDWEKDMIKAYVDAGKTLHEAARFCLFRSAAAVRGAYLK